MKQRRNVIRIALPLVAALFAGPALAHVDPAHGLAGLFGALSHAHESGIHAGLFLLPYAASFLLTALVLIGIEHRARKSVQKSL
jgi:hypothetical protein